MYCNTHTQFQFKQEQGNQTTKKTVSTQRTAPLVREGNARTGSIAKNVLSKMPVQHLKRKPYLLFDFKYVLNAMTEHSNSNGHTWKWQGDKHILSILIKTKPKGGGRHFD